MLSNNNYLKEALDFAYTEEKVKTHLKWRLDNGFTAIGVNSKLRFYTQYNSHLVLISFDYTNKTQITHYEDFNVLVGHNGNSYYLISLGNAVEVDGEDS